MTNLSINPINLTGAFTAGSAVMIAIVAILGIYLAIRVIKQIGDDDKKSGYSKQFLADENRRVERYAQQQDWKKFEDQHFAEEEAKLRKWYGEPKQ